MDWEAMARPWLSVESDIEAAHQAVLDGLMARAALKPGQRVLDVGCGMGMSLLAAAEAVGPTGRVTGIDIAPPMVERARARVPETVRVLIGDAGHHPFEEVAFDAVISLFGTMFFDDTTAAFANIRRAVHPGARMTLSAWGAPPRNPWFGVGRKAVEDVMGPQPKGDPAAPGPFRFADPAPVLKALEAGGWEASVETVALKLRPAGSPGDVADLQTIVGSAPMLLADLKVDDDRRARVRAGLERGLAEFEQGGAVHVPAEVHVFGAVARG